MRNFMTIEQVIDYLSQQVEVVLGRKADSVDRADFVSMYYGLPWYVRCIMEDGKMQFTMLTPDEIEELHQMDD